MHRVFEKVPQEIRQQAYNFYISLPPEQGRPMWRHASLPTGQQSSCCPIGAINYINGRYDSLLSGLERGLSQDEMLTSADDVGNFICMNDTQPLSNEELAELMGVKAQ